MKPLTFSILRLLSDGEFHSGVTLARHLDVSRTSISNALRGLEETGVIVHRVYGRGYRLPDPVQWLDKDKILKYLAAEKENRFSLPNTRFLVHQPSGGSRGSASDIAIQAQEIVKMRARINKLISEETGQPLERVAQDTDRDYWMSADEAIEYGIVSRIVKSASDI